MTVTLSPQQASFVAETGALHIKAALDASALSDLFDALSGHAPEQAGTRLHGLAPLRPFLAHDGPVGRAAAAVLGNAARPVRAVYFDKTAQANWAVPWHQDRTIVVRDASRSPASVPGPSRAACSTSRRPARCSRAW
ncbi:hypothetical protein SSBR45G_39530 [Bradyrhizobium sp. SSBR45G]|nr:hypothetical protein SSBR45G_39530 [Bradyrhizobium sp. SSBR45G]